jgi:pimeloyl-ACP methyl ester carboxylesterase
MDQRGICPAQEATRIAPIVAAKLAYPLMTREYASGRHRAAVLAFRTLFMALQFFPPIASRIAYRRFFRPMRSRPRNVNHLRPYDLSLKDQRVRVYEGGKGPAVLVVHGWESSVSRLEGLLHTLMAHEFRVVAFDMPAHGYSPAEDTDILQITGIIMSLAESAGPLDAAIGHSFGGVCLANAIQRKLDVARLVLVSTPSTLGGMIDKYCQALGIGRQTKTRLRRAIEKRLAPFDLERDFDLRRILQDSGVPTLVIHDRKDRVVPFYEGEGLSRARTDIELLATDNLGHSRIIRDPQTIGRCISFISQDLRG